MRARSLAVVGAFALGIVAGGMISPATLGRPNPLPDEADRRASAPAAPASKAAITGAYAAELVRVVDGDTFEARVHLWPGLDVTTKVRLRGIDAPEMKARCAEERTRAEAARDALAGILAEGALTVIRVGLDKYGGRVLADAATGRTPDISQALLDKGLARPYAGGRRQSWCG